MSIERERPPFWGVVVLVGWAAVVYASYVLGYLR
jgi:hypothetical protein